MEKEILLQIIGSLVLAISFSSAVVVVTAGDRLLG